jgi:aromatic-L-amino-acid decarboxylase
MRYSRAHPNVPLNQQVIYGTSQTHSLGAKAALILGLQFRAIEVYAKDNYALRGDSLIKALEEDHKAGKHPFVISKLS